MDTVKKVRDAQIGNANQYIIFGDSIYYVDTHLQRRHNAQPGNPLKYWLDVQDKCLNASRTLIEWHYGEGCEYWPGTVHKEAFKLGSTPDYVKDMTFFRVFIRCAPILSPALRACSSLTTLASGTATRVSITIKLPRNSRCYPLRPSFRSLLFVALVGLLCHTHAVTLSLYSQVAPPKPDDYLSW